MTPKQLDHPVFAQPCDACGAEVRDPCMLGQAEGVHPRRIAQAVKMGQLTLLESVNLPFLVISAAELDEEANRKAFVRHIVSDGANPVVHTVTNSEGRTPNKDDVASGNY